MCCVLMGTCECGGLGGGGGFVLVVLGFGAVGFVCVAFGGWGCALEGFEVEIWSGDVVRLACWSAVWIGFVVALSL